MPKTTEAQKRATANYRKRIVGTERAEKYKTKQREYSRKSIMERYNSDEHYRLEKIKQMSLRYYYDLTDDKHLRCVRRLFD
jgi:hypothetical protein